MIVLRCTCGGCKTPVATVVDGYLELRGKHHGERHVTRIPLAELQPPSHTGSEDTERRSAAP